MNEERWNLESLNEDLVFFGSHCITGWVLELELIIMLVLAMHVFLE
jgi:hypothetical protein